MFGEVFETGLGVCLGFGDKLCGVQGFAPGFREGCWVCLELRVVFLVLGLRFCLGF